jgi:hypothetical protein
VLAVVVLLHVRLQVCEVIAGDAFVLEPTLQSVGRPSLPLPIPPR